MSSPLNFVILIQDLVVYSRYIAKETVNQAKRLPIEWNKTLTGYTNDGGLVSKIKKNK